MPEAKVAHTGNGQVHKYHRWLYRYYALYSLAAVLCCFVAPDKMHVC